LAHRKIDASIKSDVTAATMSNSNNPVTIGPTILTMMEMMVTAKAVSHPSIKCVAEALDEHRRCPKRGYGKNSCRSSEKTSRISEQKRQNIPSQFWM
jgi:hypothetical protein